MIGIAQKFKYAQADKINWRRYAQNPKAVEMTQILRSHLIQLQDKQQMLPGDIIHMWFIQAPQHLAMLVWDGMIIHAHKPEGKVRIHSVDKWWLNRISGVFRFPELGEM